MFSFSPAQLILEGAVQLFVHTASKYDSCRILNFPRARSTLNLNWFCGGKDPNRHHYVVRCAPDKIPVQPDKQVQSCLLCLIMCDIVELIHVSNILFIYHMTGA